MSLYGQQKEVKTKAGAKTCPQNKKDMYFIIKETSSKRGDKWTVDSRELHQSKMFLCLDDAAKHLEKLAQYYEHRTDQFYIVTRSATRRAFSAQMMNSTGTLVFGAEYYTITKAVFYDEP